MALPKKARGSQAPIEPDKQVDETMPALEELKACTSTGKWVFITPEEAERILREHNSHNRKLGPFHWKALGRLMNGRKFKPSPLGLFFYVDGSLADGQHRLMAVVYTKIGQWMYVVRDLPFSCADVVDLNMRRSVYDTLGMEPAMGKVCNCIFQQFWLTTHVSAQVAPVEYIAETLNAELGHLLELPGRKKLSIVPIRAVLVLALAGVEGADEEEPDPDEDEIDNLKSVYRSYIENEDEDGRAPADYVKVFRDRMMSEDTRSSFAVNLDYMCRAWFMFDTTRFGKKKMKEEQADHAYMVMKKIARRRLPKLHTFAEPVELKRPGLLITAEKIKEAKLAMRSGTLFDPRSKIINPGKALDNLA